MTRSLKRLFVAAFVLLSLSLSWTAVERTRVQAAAVPTFNKEVVRIFQKNCQTCHHPGDIAPFSLMTYKEARPWAKAIREAVITKQMPPWKPVPGCGNFKDARQLTDAEIATISQWADGGAPEGDAADLPPALNFGDGWALGEPDLILSYGSDYTPPTTGDIYRAFPIPTNLRGDRYVSAIDVRPGNRKIVHHVIAYIDSTGVSDQLDAAEPGPGYTAFGGPGFNNFGILGGWAPGARPFFNLDGVATKLPKDARVVLQVHYHPSASTRVESDRTQIGIYFAKTPVKKSLNYLPLANTDFKIPAGNGRYKVTASFTTPAFVSGQIVSITPHMHLLGREMKVEMTQPGKAAECLVNINSWDFHWQGTYNYQEPLSVAGGTKFSLTAYFDNSANNPNNPNSPPVEVGWGEQTTDEMCIAFFGFTYDFEAITPSAPQLNDVGVNANGGLTAQGSGFLPGADIEINGRRLRDTTADVTLNLSSAEMWRVYAAPGQAVNVTVINPDGVRSAARTFIRTGMALSATTVPAATYSATEPVTPDGIASIFGPSLAPGTEIGTTLPLPTKLAGTTVRVNGVLASLFYVSPQQINVLVPSETQPGAAMVEVVSGDGTISRGEMTVAATAPSLFTSNSRGDGAPAALATADGITYYAVGNPDGKSNEVQTGHYLVLFGSGFRRAPFDTVKVTIGGVNAPILYAGAQPSFVGLDQLNTQIPAGVSGLVDVVLTVNGRTANVVKVLVK